jgi:hypothetical protein
MKFDGLLNQPQHFLPRLPDGGAPRRIGRVRTEAVLTFFDCHGITQHSHLTSSRLASKCC